MQNVIHGTFHFHSTYSHDGRSSLAEIASVLSGHGLSFCIMTEHFEDFDADSFARYLEEAAHITRTTGFVFVPGVEVHLRGLDTIIFPAADYNEIVRFATDGAEMSTPALKVLAHPVKYGTEAICRHLDTFRLDGIELWNQQADGSRMPPLPLLDRLAALPGVNSYRGFFGADIHDVTLKVTNVLSIERPVAMTAAAIADAFRRGPFVSRNTTTGVEFRNGSEPVDLHAWLANVRRKSYLRGRVMRAIRRTLRLVYRTLPRDTQHSLNDFKNAVRNRV